MEYYDCTIRNCEMKVFLPKIGGLQYVNLKHLKYRIDKQILPRFSGLEQHRGYYYHIEDSQKCVIKR